MMDAGIKDEINNNNENNKEVCVVFNDLNLKSDLKVVLKDPPKSENRCNDISERSMPAPIQQLSVVGQQLTPAQQFQRAQHRKQLKLQILTILLEYLAGCSNINVTDRAIKVTIPPSALKLLVFDTYHYMMNKSVSGRLHTGELFAELIIRETLPMATYCSALEEVFSTASQNAIINNNPNVWSSYAELIAPIVSGRVLQFKRLKICCESLIPLGYAQHLLASLFKIIMRTHGTNMFMCLWQISDLRLQEFMNPEQVEIFITENDFHFMKYMQ